MSKIPPLLSSALALPPESSLILLTNILGASTNWLVLRYLYSALLTNEETNVVLGLDLEKFILKKRVVFVDGLEGLYVTQTPQKHVTMKSTEQIMLSIRSAIRELQSSSGKKTLLVIDQLDLLLAMSGDESRPVQLGDMLLDLREEAHSVVVTMAADSPLVTEQETPLEINHAALLLHTAHQADLTISLRLLDSGTARDVSGVIRITRGDVGFSKQDAAGKIEERELLYFVGGDGSVKVFERGQ
ncbi:hypothetical protein GLAREA_08324 [Glarea lozoyensis ATCC 20868]|uniref:Elongator complex protein 6 n=1 Tax=Glarea lozoyensis (strain ATCC 20868 / MF5171) TaxID=1116229 RepID=S3CD54_GLAL2|nr:uncharacterized protein GLAREA_08324 [Glarea lozoyensis ATCC 20868]EPE24472.1 hypothetical protein GLAREA_08324 [Glarea lozoyensis ATCC 20868]